LERFLSGADGWMTPPTPSLTDAVVKQALESDQPLADYRCIVEQHKKDIERYRTFHCLP